MRNRMRLLLAVLGLLLLGGVAVALEAPEILQRWVLASGGGAISSAGYRLNSTMGQSIVGEASSAGYRLKAGYWSGLGAQPTVGATPTRTATPTKTLTPVPGLAPRVKIPIITKNYWSP
jgi:hypothetical protein